MSTKIEWAEETWNPVIGCTKVSAGCKNCYAERMSSRLANMGQAVYQRVVQIDYERDIALPQWNNAIKLLPSKLTNPFHWKKPRTIFVCSMSDLFHKDVPFAFIDNVFAVMACSPRHVFYVLTKRPERMAGYLLERSRSCTHWEKAAREIGYTMRFNGNGLCPFPLPNVILGTSIENQTTFDYRIHFLLRCPAVARFLSLEPLLGPVDLSGVLTKAQWGKPNSKKLRPHEVVGRNDLIHQVIVGGESGPGARPMHLDWARSLRDQCKAAGVPFFFKQWGEWLPCEDGPDGWYTPSAIPVSDLRVNTTLIDSPMARVGKKAAGRLLDGVEHNGIPQLIARHWEKIRP